ncbi:MAG: hypothetical protein ACLFPL_04850 [Candidatus Nanoarchaeia archaeon]
MEQHITSIIVLLIILIISALPLHFAVKIMGGKTYLIKTILVMFLSSIIVVLVNLLLPYGAILAFIVLIWIYREMFRLKWIKALLVWLLQLIFVTILLSIAALIGVSFTIFSISSSLLF